MTDHEAQTLLRECAAHTKRKRNPPPDCAWSRWEGAPENDLPDTRLVLHTARPEPGATVAVWCLLGVLVLVLAGMLGKGLGWW